VTIDYQRDDIARRVTVTVDGPFDAAAWHAGTGQRHQRERVWTYAMLYDLRGLTGDVSMEDLKAMFTVTLRVATTAERGPVAVVVTDETLYARACMFAALGRQVLRVQVCRDLEEAEAWLVTPPAEA
jgi:hypothetical protein